MKTFLIMGFATFLSTAALAGVDPGTYTGIKADTSACSIEFVSTQYENGLQHPLNERVKVIVDGTEYVLTHPYRADVAKGSVLFAKEHLEGVRGIPSGAAFVQVDMVHSPEFHGPKAFRFIKHDYKTAANNAQYECTLKH